MDKKQLDSTTVFAPQFNESGLIPCITSCAKSGEVLMFAFMNEEALRKTLETREMHYYSRSRKELWHKGATSGHTQKLISIYTDCDQDCIWAKIEPVDAACHTGRSSCFYREIENMTTLKDFT